VKELKLRPKTDDHDLEFKARAARRFIESGNKVKLTCRFRGREIMHPQKAREQLDWIVKQCEDIANVEHRPNMEGRTMTTIMAPKPAVLQVVAATKAQQERDRKEAELARLAAKGKRHLGEGEEAPDDDLDDDEDYEDDDDDDLEDDDDTEEEDAIS
jgi:translation initiation factor IF-3